MMLQEHRALRQGSGFDQDQTSWLLHEEIMSMCDVKDLADFLKSERKPLATLVKSRGRKK